jgi:hypothetical protein
MRRECIRRRRHRSSRCRRLACASMSPSTARRIEPPASTTSTRPWPASAGQVAHARVVFEALDGGDRAGEARPAAVVAKEGVAICSSAAKRSHRSAVWNSTHATPAAGLNDPVQKYRCNVERALLGQLAEHARQQRIVLRQLADAARRQLGLRAPRRAASSARLFFSMDGSVLCLPVFPVFARRSSWRAQLRGALQRLCACRSRSS